MSHEFTIIVIMAVITGGLRYAGFGIARLLEAYPKAKEGIAGSSFCLISSYISVQLLSNPKLLIPVGITICVSYLSSGILIPLLLGWLSYIVWINTI